MKTAATMPWDHWQRRAWVAAGVGLLTCVAGLLVARPRIFQAYWMAWMFWSGLSFGSLAMLMLHVLTGGAWGDAVRPAAEASAMTLPLMGGLFLLALPGLGDIFSWAHAGAFEGHDWPHKSAYLTAPWFAVRGLGYLIVLSVLTGLLGLWTRREATPPDGAVPRPYSQALSAGGLVLYVALMLFTSTDWCVSLEPQWSSTMPVVILVVEHFLSALAFVIVVLTTLPLAVPLPTKALHDLGNLLLAFVVFWAYVTFSQFLIIWSGNLPREISWYRHRASGGWPAVALALLLLQFAVPFALLLLRMAKRHRRILGPIAGLVLAGSAVHTCWLITPSFSSSGVPFLLPELAAFVGIGGLWCAFFLGYLQRRTPALLPLTREVANG